MLRGLTHYRMRQTNVILAARSDDGHARIHPSCPAFCDIALIPPAQEALQVKSTIAIFATILVLTTGHLQAQSGKEVQTVTPIAGIDDAALARSARASKIIGSKVYKGDTSIGQIEDVLVDLIMGPQPR
jgi:hypothetical protein